MSRNEEFAAGTGRPELSWHAFPHNTVVHLPTHELNDAYFPEHDVYGYEVEDGYQRRLQENREHGIGPDDPGYHPGDEPATMDSLTASVKKQGVREPLEVSFGEGTTPVITDGNHRYLAAVRAGAATVPVIRRDQ